jgi:hypothetical protein
MMIESELHLRQKQAPKLTNFQNTLPAAKSDMAQAMLKDPYCFEFLDIQEPAQERALEEALVDNIRDFLLHLGKGFSFTIGILLCKSKNEVVAEYSLKGTQSPIGISQYELGKALTQHLQMHDSEKLEQLENMA